MMIELSPDADVNVPRQLPTTGSADGAGGATCAIAVAKNTTARTKRQIIGASLLVGADRDRLGRSKLRPYC